VAFVHAVERLEQASKPSAAQVSLPTHRNEISVETEVARNDERRLVNPFALEIRGFPAQWPVWVNLRENPHLGLPGWAFS
jgi:hypothetical protein